MTTGWKATAAKLAKKSVVDGQRAKTFRGGGRGARSVPVPVPVVLVTLGLSLALHVPGASGTSVGGGLFPLGHGAALFGHGLQSGIADNSSLSCPGSCVCTDTQGFRVDCSGQNLTQVPREIPAGTTHL